MRPSRELVGQRLVTALRRPLVRHRRRRWATEDPLARSMLEAVDYRRSMVDFMAATRRDPDILVDADLDERSVVVDGGAYVGEWCSRIADRYACRIVAFEPVPAHVAELQRRLGGRTGITVVPAALGARDGQEAVVLGGPGSHIAIGAPSADGLDVEVRDVATALDALEIEHIDLLKLNIEGGEYDVLDRLAATGWLDRVGDLLVQFHPHHPGAPARRRRIRRHLSATHDEAWNYPWVWERWVSRQAPERGLWTTAG